MENLISLVNKIQRACTALDDHCETRSLPTLWDSLPSIIAVGGQSVLRAASSTFGIVSRQPLVLQPHKIDERSSKYAEFLHLPRKSCCNKGNFRLDNS